MSEDASPSRSGSTGGGGVRGLYVRVLLRLLPPLVITKEEMDEGLAILKQTLMG